MGSGCRPQSELRMALTIGRHLHTPDSLYHPLYNGKVRFTLELPTDMVKEEVEKAALGSPEAAKYLEGQQVVKTVVVPGRIINIVIKPL